MVKIKISAAFIVAIVLTNLICLDLNAGLFAKIKDVNPEFVQEGIASWYGPGFQGRKTANGERFDTEEMTAAHKTLPFNTLVKVTNLDNGSYVVVRINDRGPFVKGRIIDLSKAAKNEIQMGGLAKVRIEIAEEEEEEIEEEVVSPVNLFEDEFPPDSKIFIEWDKDTANPGEITDEQLNLFLNSSKIRIKVLTPDVTDANSIIYQELSANSNFNYFEITKKISFFKGYALEVGIFADKALASELINKLESEKFNNIFLEEILSNNPTVYKVYVGNHKSIQETKDDIVKLLDMDKDVKYRIVKIGS